VGVLIWIVAGAVVGWLVSRLAPARLPGGILAYCLGGMAGGFVGGGVIALLTGRNATTVDPLGIVVAVAGAAVLVLIVRKAAHAEPRTRTR
jgi:uncharacterized membrane protein YeaQ/YmgE (transglycosylase-associated protein family)